MRIYVGNLAEETTRREVRETFAPYGAVSRVAVISDFPGGSSRSYGYVEMAQPEEGERAIAQLHGSKLGAHTLRVREARQKTNGN